VYASAEGGGGARSANRLGAGSVLLLIDQEDDMTRKLAAVVVAAVAAAAAAGANAAGSALLLGPSTPGAQPTFEGYYDGHKDAYLVTDVSSKAQASALHVNYSPPLAKTVGAPPQYFVRGRAAAGQLAVFGSEPGESDYNPLWEEIWVTWKPGAKPRSSSRTTRSRRSPRPAS
jgi:hypothetical protein